LRRILTKISQVAFLSNALQQLICNRGRQRLPDAKHPDAMLLRERSSTPNRTQSDLLASALYFQGVSRLQTQLFPQRLWDNDAASFVYD